MKDPRRAACNYKYSYNYSYSLRDPGGAYHNGRYVLQILYDSLESLAASGKAGVEMRGKVWP